MFKIRFIEQLPITAHYPKCVILSERQRVEESSHNQKCVAEI